MRFAWRQREKRRIDKIDIWREQMRKTNGRDAMTHAAMRASAARHAA
jgi:hypothetical protein